MAPKGKYHAWLTTEGLLKLEGWARDGLIDEQIARNIGINTSTLYEWLKKYPSIAEALKKGKDVVDRQVENALLRRALGYSYVEKTVEIDPSGSERIKITHKEMAPDTTAQIFWLKNRKPKDWRDKQHVDNTIEVEDLTSLVELLK